METISGNTYNIIETRTQNGGIEWRLASKTSKKSKLAQVRELEKEFAEIKKLVQELTDSGEIANMNFNFDDDEDLLEDEQAVLSASKNTLDFDDTVDLLSRKSPEKINADKFEHYIKTHRPGKAVKSASSNYHVLGYHQPNRTNSADDLLIAMGGTIEPTKETRRAAVNPAKSGDDLLKKLGGGD